MRKANSLTPCWEAARQPVYGPQFHTTQTHTTTPAISLGVWATISYTNLGATLGIAGYSVRPGWHGRGWEWSLQAKLEMVLLLRPVRKQGALCFLAGVQADAAHQLQQAP